MICEKKSVKNTQFDIFLFKLSLCDEGPLYVRNCPYVTSMILPTLRALIYIIITPPRRFLARETSWQHVNE